MKSVLLAVSALIVILIIKMVADNSMHKPACGQVAQESSWGNGKVSVVSVKGHEYVIVNGSNKGGIVHSESCPCKNGGAR